MNFRKIKIPFIDFSKPKLSQKNLTSFRKFWNYYCKDLPPKRAISYLIHSYPEKAMGEVVNMYKAWRKEYLVSEEW